MANYIRILEHVEVYANHTEDSFTSKTLKKNEIVEYNREKRRNKINWIEFYSEDGQVAYLKKDKSKIFICEALEVNDTEIQGFRFTSKTAQNYTFAEVFTPIQEDERNEILKQHDGNIGIVEMKRITSDEVEITEKIDFKYDKTKVDLKMLNLYKEYDLLMIDPNYKTKNSIMEINVENENYFVLTNSSFSDPKNKWLLSIAIFASFATLMGIIITICEKTGWLVISGLMLIPMMIVVTIVSFILVIISETLKSIFSQIRKRF